MKTVRLLCVLAILVGCATGSEYVPPEAYEFAGKSDLNLLIAFTTGSVEHGASTRMMSAGNNVYVTVPGEAQSDWGYGAQHQQAFIYDLKTVLDNNSAFSSTAIAPRLSETCCDAELNIFFVSTEQSSDVPIYNMEVVVTLKTPDGTFENRHIFQTNTIAEILLSWSTSFEEAQNKANDELMNRVLADLGSWL